MALEKARNLKELYSLFSPKNQLETEEELRLFYVDRHCDTRENIKLDLELNAPSHLLFTGHRGSGKSTEINKLCSELDGQFFIVKVLLKGRNDTSYIDVILKAANTLFKDATKKEIIDRAPKQIKDDFFDMLGDFIQNKIYGKYNPLADESNKSKLKLSVGAKVNYLAAEFEAKFEAEPESRKHFRENSELLVAELIDKINMLSEKIQDAYGSPVLFIFEDADKFDLETAQKIFYEHSNTLTSIRASSIYIIDIALLYDTRFNNARANFSEDFCLPNVKLLSREGEAIAENYQLLEKLIDNRAETHLLSTDAKQLLINYSGGLIRSLVDLVQSAARRAIVQRNEIIDTADVEHAINRMRGDFIPLLNDNYYALLHDKHLSKRLDNQPDTQKLLESLSLLEYENGQRWCDVHPIILQEVENRVASSMPQ